MKKVLILIGILGLTLLMATGAFAREAPHDASNNFDTTNCTDCHNYRPNGVYADSVCQRCHINDTGGGYSKESAPKMITHQGKECRDCHDIHWQLQSADFGPQAWLVTGTITSRTDNGDGTTTFGYSNLTINNADYADPATWSQKSANASDGNERGLLIINQASWRTAAEIISADASTITVQGTTFSYGLNTGNNFGLSYGMFLRTSMNGVVGPVTTKVFDSSGQGLAFDESVTGTDPTPVGVCQICHTTTTHWRYDGTLADHNSGVNCIDCHKHEEGFIASCNTCHGDPPIVDSPVQDGLITTDRNNQPNVSGSATSGAHQTHAAFFDGPNHSACDRCHKDGMQDAGTGSTGADDLINIGFTLGTSDLGGNYDGQSAVAGSFYDYAGTGTTTVTTGDTLQCSNVYCHSSGQGTTANDPNPVYATPQWDTPSTGQCGTCHSNTDPGTGSHTAHINGNAQCGDCHADAGDGTAYNSANHINQLIDVANAYTKGGLPGNDYGTCSTASCHTTVQGDGGVAGVEKVTPKWGTPTACGECHDAVPSTGRHSSHLGFSGGIAIDCDSCHNSAPHRDDNIDILIAIGGSYSQMPTNPIGNGYGTCSAVYCHSSGQGATANDGNPVYSTPDWSDASTGQCGTCHSNTDPATGSHSAHINNGAQCGDCHTGAGNGTAYSSANHINQLIDVANGYDMGGAAGNGYGTCSTASCHGGYMTPQWGATITPGDECNVCHASPPATGAHASHALTTPTAYGETTVNNLGGEQYDFGCGNCHPTDEATYHRNGTVDLSLNKLDGGPIKIMNNVSDQTSGYAQTVGTSVTCNAAYCHSNGYQDNLVYQTSPDWYGGAFVGDKCSNCHGNSPNSGGIVGSVSHYTTDAMGTGEIGGHFVGIHYDNIYTGSTGLEAAGNTPRGSHGNAATSSTINCQTCHNDTVAVSANDQNIICSGCHGATAALQGAAVINTAGSTHVNGQPDVVFNATEVLTKAQLRDASIPAQWDRTTSGVGYKADGAYDESVNRLLTGSQYDGGTKTCAVACHNDNPVQWGDTGVDCNSCHTGL